MFAQCQCSALLPSRPASRWAGSCYPRVTSGAGPIWRASSQHTTPPPGPTPLSTDLLKATSRATCPAAAGAQDGLQLQLDLEMPWLAGSGVIVITKNFHHVGLRCTLRARDFLMNKLNSVQGFWVTLFFVSNDSIIMAKIGDTVHHQYILQRSNCLVRTCCWCGVAIKLVQPGLRSHP